MGNNEEKRKKILIVEDHDALRSSLHKWLSTIFPGCDFLEAGDGEEALSLTKKYQPEIVLMDIKLPHMNGIMATTCITETVPNTHVVMLSMYDISDYKSASKLAGAVAYVAKHQMYTELVPIINKLLSNKENLLLKKT